MEFGLAKAIVLSGVTIGEGAVVAMWGRWLRRMSKHGRSLVAIWRGSS